MRAARPRLAQRKIKQAQVNVLGRSERRVAAVSLLQTEPAKPTQAATLTRLAVGRVGCVRCAHAAALERFAIVWSGLAFLSRPNCPAAFAQRLFRLAHFLGHISSISIGLAGRLLSVISQRRLVIDCRPRNGNKSRARRSSNLPATVIDLLWSPRVSRENISR